ncbi:MAG: cytochrome c [Chloroflexi bacterium]|nr:cytochrome c [Chloroflexota bacterium]
MHDKRSNGWLQASLLMLGVSLLVALMVSAQLERRLVLPAVFATYTPYSGRWLHTEIETLATIPLPPMQLILDVAADGAISGQLSLFPLDVPPNAVDLIARNGCTVVFDTLIPGTEAIQGVFVSDSRAIIQIQVSECQVKYFGPIALSAPVSARFTVEYSEAATRALERAANATLTPLDAGLQVFATYCAVCHGAYGEGAPGVPDLDTADISTRPEEQLLTIINLGIANTGMPAWGQILTDAEKTGVLLVLRNIQVLRP